MKRHDDSILMTGVLLKRGNPEHYEHKDETARTYYNENGTVASIHTPQNALKRTHEIMHANHTTSKHLMRKYHKHGIIRPVLEIIEDCAIHTHHWPWEYFKTPPTIMKDVNDVIEYELAKAKEQEEENRKNQHITNGFGEFATRLRAVAIREATGVGCRYIFNSRNEADLANDILSEIRCKNFTKAAFLLQNAFFDVEIKVEETNEMELEGYTDKGKKVKIPVRKQIAGSKPGHDFKVKSTQLEIIELPHTIQINSESKGKRIAKSGMRLYRPALRKPELPQRMFIRRARKDPGGTILIDASGSMGRFDKIEQWCQESPYATLAYYAGDGNGHGQLFVYARDGYRSENAIHPKSRNNVVDGLAIDWLLKQDGPLVMITDREFGGAYDSRAQRTRLDNLERQGKITVKNYNETRRDK